LIDPRCKKKRGEGKTPVVLSATGYLKPCTYYSAAHHFIALQEWALEKGLDIEDLNIHKNNIEEIYNSNLWKSLLEGFNTYDLPEICHKRCSKVSTKNTSEVAVGWRKHVV
jgi:hypothetical protein